MRTTAVDKTVARKRVRDFLKLGMPRMVCNLDKQTWQPEPVEFWVRPLQAAIRYFGHQNLIEVCVEGEDVLLVRKS